MSKKMLRKKTYVCRDGHRTITAIRDDGQTPNSIMCRRDGCFLAAICRMQHISDIPTPTHEWIKPSIAEIEECIARQEKLAGELIDRGLTDASQPIRERVLAIVTSGGLLLREISTGAM